MHKANSNLAILQYKLLFLIYRLKKYYPLLSTQFAWAFIYTTTESFTPLHSHLHHYTVTAVNSCMGCKATNNKPDQCSPSYWHIPFSFVNMYLCIRGIDNIVKYAFALSTATLMTNSQVRYTTTINIYLHS